MPGIFFRANDPSGINGQGGWVTGTIKQALNDDGELQITFPNSVGSDGIQHIRRFGCITNNTARLGEEWLEVTREDGNKLIAVTAIAGDETDLSTITLTCANPLALLTLSREEMWMPWCAAPRDIIAYYTQLEHSRINVDFIPISTPSTTSGTFNGFDYTGAVANPAGDGIRLLAPASLKRTIPVVNSRCMTVQYAGRWENGIAMFSVYGVSIIVETVTSGAGNIAVLSGTETVESTSDQILAGQTFVLRIVQRGHIAIIQLNGETTAVVNTPTYTATVSAVNIGPLNPGTDSIVISQISVIEPFPYLHSDSEPGDRHLPGSPVPGGLAARYFDGGSAHAQDRDEYPGPLSQEYANRIDQTINWPASATPAWMPAGPASNWWSARWTGAIYLDLEASDRELEITRGPSSCVRVWCGRTGPYEQPLVDIGPPFSPTTAYTGSLRDKLGTVAGWYPIIIEYANADNSYTGNSGITLKDRASIGTGTTTVVPASRLSPYGIFEDEINGDSFRDVLARVSEEWGYQWVIEPRSLESGSFPGRLIPRTREGRDVNLTVTELDITAPRASRTLTDAADRLLIDVSGMARPDAGNMRAEVINTATTEEHMFLSTVAESAPQITDSRLAMQRATSLLALHSGPLEQLGVTVPGRRQLVDTFPLTGQLARMEWQPGDAPMFQLPQLGVADTSPRQITSVTWPIRPDGVGPAALSTRSRPRGMRNIPHRALQIASAQTRAPSGQLTETPGSLAGSGGTLTSTLTTLGVVVQLHVVVLALPTGQTLRVSVNDNQPITLANRGAFDVTGQKTASSVQIAKFTPLTVGNWSAQLIARVVI
jgi:hypothetical protein